MTNRQHTTSTLRTDRIRGDNDIDAARRVVEHLRLLTARVRLCAYIWNTKMHVWSNKLWIQVECANNTILHEYLTSNAIFQNHSFAILRWENTTKVGKTLHKFFLRVPNQPSTHAHRQIAIDHTALESRRRLDLALQRVHFATRKGNHTVTLPHLSVRARPISDVRCQISDVREYIKA